MERAWDINPGASPAITVAVLDTGAAYQNVLQRYFARSWNAGAFVFPALGIVDVPVSAAPELGGRERFVSPRDFIWNDDTPDDLDGHGTHVAGTIGQLTNNGVGVAGMAFNVRLMPVKVLDTIWDFIFNSPEFATDDVLARGIRYAVDNGAKVLNLSLGRTGAPAPVVRDAIVYAVSRGAFVAVAAGNDFLRGNPTKRPADVGPDGGRRGGGRRGPGQSAGLLLEHRCRSWSYGTGRRPVARRHHGRHPPAVVRLRPHRYRPSRPSTVSDTAVRCVRVPVLQGTSMAAPHVAGFAALLMQQGITSPAAVEAIMKRSATDLGPPGRDDAYGYGLINPRAALRGMGLLK